MKWQDRISINPHVCHGRPCIKGTRVMVSVILANIGEGETAEAMASAKAVTGSKEEDQPISQVKSNGERTMPRTLPFDAAKGSLRELVDGMVPGEELVLTSHGEPIAIVTRPPRTSWPCQPGSAKETKHWMAPDFNAPLEDFKEYME